MHTLLYVDDEPANLLVFEEIVGSDNGSRVLTASSGAAALAILASDPDIAVVLSDQRMPGMTGVELLEQVARQYPRVARLLVTAYSDLQSAIAAINRGAVHRYLRKPWQPDELRMEVADAVARFAQAERLHSIERRLATTERVYTLGVVAAGLVHELRNPIGVVSNYVDLAREALERMPGEAAAHVHKLLDGAAAAAERMIEIVRGVELSTRRRASTDRANLAEVVELTLGMIQSDLRARAEVEVNIPAGTWVPISPTHLSQVLLNLVANAIEVLAEHRRRGGKISIRAVSSAKGIRVEVADNGPGIPAQLRDKIFDAFYTTKDDGGTGLGLAIARQIAADAGGTLVVTDTPGGGATFVLTLPAAVP